MQENIDIDQFDIFYIFFFWKRPVVSIVSANRTAISSKTAPVTVPSTSTNVNFLVTDIDGNIQIKPLSDIESVQKDILSRLGAIEGTYATQGWVNDKGYATQGWVNGNNYAKWVSGGFMRDDSHISGTHLQ